MDSLIALKRSQIRSKKNTNTTMQPIKLNRADKIQIQIGLKYKYKYKYKSYKYYHAAKLCLTGRLKRRQTAKTCLEKISGSLGARASRASRQEY